MGLGHGDAVSQLNHCHSLVKLLSAVLISAIPGYLVVQSMKRQTSSCALASLPGLLPPSTPRHTPQINGRTHTQSRLFWSSALGRTGAEAMPTQIGIS